MMVTKVIDLEQHSGDVSALLTEMDDQTVLILTRAGKPIARIIPEYTPLSQERTPGLHSGTTWVSDDFDVPLSDQFWLGDA